MSPPTVVTPSTAAIFTCPLSLPSLPEAQADSRQRADHPLPRPAVLGKVHPELRGHVVGVVHGENGLLRFLSEGNHLLHVGDPVEHRDREARVGAGCALPGQVLPGVPDELVQAVVPHIRRKAHGAVVRGVRYVRMNVELVTGHVAAGPPPFFLDDGRQFAGEVACAPAVQVIGIVDANENAHVYSSCTAHHFASGPEGSEFTRKAGAL